jgi:hypothetical protein
VLGAARRPDAAMTTRAETIAPSEPSGATGTARTAAKPRVDFHPELDGVRGMMMAAVFLFHCAPRTGVAVFDGFVGSMWISIDVFFALSGFLITRNLLDDRHNVYRYRNFCWNRAPAHRAGVPDRAVRGLRADAALRGDGEGCTT